MDLYYMEEAYKEACLAYKLGEVPVGAVLVYNGKIIARNHNKRESSKDPLAHAEILVIKEASKKLDSWRLSGASLYVTLEPCSMCAGAIVNSRIDRLIYAASDPKRGCCGTVMNLLDRDEFNHKAEVKSGILADRSAKLLSGFFEELRRNKKF